MKHTTILSVVLLAAASLAGTVHADDNDDDSAGPENKTAETRVTGGESVVIHFAATVSQLNTDGLMKVDEVAGWLDEDSDRGVVIATLPSSVTNDIKLSDARAEEIRVYLSIGVDSEQRAKIRVLKPNEPVPEAALDDPNLLGVFYAAAAEEQSMAIGTTLDDEPEASPVTAGTTIYPPRVNVYPPPKTRTASAPIGPAPAENRQSRPAHLMTTMGLGLSIGGGVTGFVGDEMRAFTSVGGAWEARVVLGTRTVIAGEAAYVGSAQSTDLLGLDDSALIVGNGVEGNVRVNVSSSAVQPYVFGGAGWSRFTLERADFNTSSVRDAEDVLFLPVGAGLSFRSLGLMIDLRGTYRAAFGDNIIRGSESDVNQPGDVSMDSWTASAKVGWEF